ncbi:WD40-repeat-containing domain protein [Lipomyces arxii]|uniref:WD40-repeat-containing domain protein n=1 Tax=Lipomyces arxii TaxID=56418 RepID=UPI0034CD7C79
MFSSPVSNSSLRDASPQSRRKNNASFLGDITDQQNVLNGRHRGVLTPDPSSIRKKARVSDERPRRQSIVCESVSKFVDFGASRLSRRLFVRELEGRRFFSVADANRHDFGSWVSGASEDVNVVRSGKVPFAVASGKVNAVSAVADEGGHVTLFDVDTRKSLRKPLFEMACHSNAVFDVAFSDDDLLFATASGDQTGRVFDVQTQKCVAELQPCDGHSLKQISFAGSSSVIATTTRGGTVSLFDVRAGVRSGTRSSVEVLPVAQISRAHNPEKGRRAQSSVPARSVTALAVDGSVLLTGGENGSSVRKWDVRTLSLEKRFARPVACTADDGLGGVTALKFDTVGSRVWSLTRSGVVAAYSPVFGDRADVLQTVSAEKLKVGSFYVKLDVASEMAVRAGGLSGGGGAVACGSTDKCVVVFPESGRGVGGFARPQSSATAFVGGHRTEVTAVSWTCEGQLISISDDVFARRWRRPSVQFADAVEGTAVVI